MNEELLESRFAFAQEAERSRIARELHDDFAQRLVSLAQSLRELAGRETVSENLRELEALARSAAQIGLDLGQVARHLHPAILQDLGLSAALEAECSRFSTCHGIPVEHQIMHYPTNIAPSMALSLFRVAQESLANVAKHAEASEVHVHLLAANEQLLLSIWDNSRGFCPKTESGKGGLGLTSMSERIRLVNGKLIVQSQPGRGTSVVAIVPAEGDSANRADPSSG